MGRQGEMQWNETTSNGRRNGRGRRGTSEQLEEMEDQLEEMAHKIGKEKSRRTRIVEHLASVQLITCLRCNHQALEKPWQEREGGRKMCTFIRSRS